MLALRFETQILKLSIASELSFRLPTDGSHPIYITDFDNIQDGEFRSVSFNVTCLR